MNIPEIVGKALDIAWSVTSSITVTCTYHRVVAGSYSPSAGTNPATEVQTTVKALFGVFAQRDIDGVTIQAGDKKIFIRTSELATKPESADYLVDAAGKKWRFTQIDTEPSGKLWMLYARGHAK